jgi:hypothetical protein
MFHDLAHERFAASANLLTFDNFKNTTLKKNGLVFHRRIQLAHLLSFDVAYDELFPKNVGKRIDVPRPNDGFSILR